MRRDSWRPIVDDASTVLEIRKVIDELADRAVKAADSILDPSLSDGLSGIAVLLNYMAVSFGDQNRRDQALSVLARACGPAVVDANPLKHRSVGLFTGLSGFAWTISYVAGETPPGRRMLDSLHGVISHRISKRVFIPDDDVRLPPAEYDIIDGLAGVGLHLLKHYHNPTCSQDVGRILEVMVWLSGSGDELPRGFVPPDLPGGLHLRDSFPDGWWNLGVAHGLLGPLALLSKSKSEGLAYEMCTPAIRNLLEWILSHSRADDWGINWPAFSGPERCSCNGTQLARAGWCYGSPGVSRVLSLAGWALQDEDIISLAVDSMIAVTRRPANLWRIDTSLCHGLAGLLQMSLRFYYETKDPLFRDFALSLTDTLMDKYDSTLAFGYANKGYDGEVESTHSLLVGGLGPALALASVTSDVPPDWDTVFAIS